MLDMSRESGCLEKFENNSFGGCELSFTKNKDLIIVRGFLRDVLFEWL
jgi:hypothetical protein